MSGVLLTADDGTLYFVEKVAFQEPYRLLRFADRTELSDYLMGKYDVSWGQSTARPFIMENDEWMDGWRPNPAAPTQRIMKRISCAPLVHRQRSRHMPGALPFFSDPGSKRSDIAGMQLLPALPGRLTSFAELPLE